MRRSILTLFISLFLIQATESMASIPGWGAYICESDQLSYNPKVTYDFYRHSKGPYFTMRRDYTNDEFRDADPFIDFTVFRDSTVLKNNCFLASLKQKGCHVREMYVDGSKLVVTETSRSGIYHWGHKYYAEVIFDLNTLSGEYYKEYRKRYGQQKEITSVKFQNCKKRADF